MDWYALISSCLCIYSNFDFPDNYIWCEAPFDRPHWDVIVLHPHAMLPEGLVLPIAKDRFFYVEGKDFPPASKVTWTHWTASGGRLCFYLAATRTSASLPCRGHSCWPRVYPGLFFPCYGYKGACKVAGVHAGTWFIRDSSGAEVHTVDCWARSRDILCTSWIQ